MDALEARLRAHGIDPTRFGQGSAKSLAHLVAELANGEAALIEQDGRLVRRVGVLNVDVLADHAGRRLRLVEDRQEFADGRVRLRALPCSVAEKLHDGEDRTKAVARALAEELGITRYRLVSGFEDAVKADESPSYPGLRSEYAITRIAVLIDPAEYRPSYREDQPDKSTFFAWEKAPV